MKTQTPKTGRPQRTKQSTRASSGHRASGVTLKQRRAAYPLHKRVMLHPLGLFAFLCVGVFMAGWTYRVVAATIISGTVEAPPLQTAATLESPVGGVTSKAAQINVTGSCPPNSYVTLNVNDSFNGVSWCASDSSYQIVTSLYSGNNTLVVQDYNQTNEPGPTSAPIQVTYTPPPTPHVSTGGQSAAASSSTGGSSSPNTSSTDSSTKPEQASGSNTTAPAQAAPLLLTSNFQFHAFTSQQTFNWQLDLEGGTPPYKVAITWGDHKTSNLTFPGDPIFTISHKYATAGYYPVIVRSVDSTGQLHTTQLAALITNANGTAPFVNSGTTTTTGGSSGPVSPTGTMFSSLHLSGTMKWLLLAWPSYLIVLLMTISFWLGEKQEFALLRAYRRPSIRR